MKIIERFEMGKQGDKESNEDAIVFSENFAAVIDGCSCRSGVTYDGKTPGKVASEIVANAIKALNPNATADEAALFLDRNINEWYRKKGIYDFVKDNPQARCSCYYAIYSRARRQVWVLGDCQALVAGHLITYSKLIDKLHEQFRSFIIRAKLLQGAKESELLKRQAELRVIAKAISDYQPIFQNTSDDLFGYSCIDGFYLPGPMLQVEDVPYGTDEIVLATDGYAKVLPSLDETEDVLAGMLRRDPLCYRENMSVKGVMPKSVSFDDRSYLRIKID